MKETIGIYKICFFKNKYREVSCLLLRNLTTHFQNIGINFTLFIVMRIMVSEKTHQRHLWIY